MCSISCINKIFIRWDVKNFQTKFVGTINRLLNEEPRYTLPPPPKELRLGTVCIDEAFWDFVMKDLHDNEIPLAHPGIFLFLPYLHRLRVFEMATTVLDSNTPIGYSWFSLLLLNIGRILSGLCSISRTCKTSELSIPLMAGLVSMPCNDSLLNGLATISEDQLLSLRRYLTKAAFDNGLIECKSIAFDFHMRDFTGDDIKMKDIGKGPSP